MPAYAIESRTSKVHGKWTLFFFSPRTGGPAPDTVAVRTNDIVRIRPGDAFRLDVMELLPGSDVIANDHKVVNRMAQLTPADSDALAEAYLDVTEASEDYQTAYREYVRALEDCRAVPMADYKGALTRRERFERSMDNLREIIRKRTPVLAKLMGAA